jgi:hypothetical protein
MALIELPLDELAALGTAVGVPIPASVTTIVGRIPAPPAPPATTTTLALALAATDTTVQTVDPYPAQRSMVLVIDTERMIVTDRVDDHHFRVVRGVGGTTAAAHLVAAGVSMSAATATERMELHVALALRQQGYEPATV